ncbi:hypothetical protein GCM10009767_19880 [Kocuria aegyptia]|uniref:Uncharacterized protein n=1 Tax=Kocuria aegyptia TaxID=330943 RepID=A0ABP4WR01_9MICC
MDHELCATAPEPRRIRDLVTGHLPETVPPVGHRLVHRSAAGAPDIRTAGEASAVARRAGASRRSRGGARW